MFFLAKELGMTVAQLTKHLTQEELVGWAAFFEIQAEEREKASDQAQMGRGARAMARR